MSGAVTSRRAVAAPSPTGITIADLETAASQIAHCHRGAGGMVGRDNALSAMQYTAALNLPVIIDAGDPQRLPDGTWVCSHDTTTSRVLTGGAADVYAHSGGSWRRQKFQVAGYMSGGNVDNSFGNLASFMGPAVEAPPTVADVLQALGGKAALNFGMKLPQPGMTDLEAVEDLCKLIAQFGCQRSVSVGVGHPDPAKVQMARSYGLGGVSVGADNEADYTAAAIINSGADYFSPRWWITGADSNASWDDAFLQQLADAGMGIWPWYAKRRVTMDAWRARPGVQYVVSDDPLYAFRHLARYATDQFAQGLYLPGMLPANGHVRGYPDPAGTGRLVFDSTAGNGQWMLMGHMSDDNLLATMYEFSITMDALGSDNTRLAMALLWCEDDRNVSNIFGSTPVGQGYEFAIRPDGHMYLGMRNGATLTTLHATPFQTAIPVAGQRMDFRVELVDSTGTQTPTGDRFKLTRLDSGETVTTDPDSTYRGGYFHFGVNYAAAGLKASFSRVTVTG